MPFSRKPCISDFFIDTRPGGLLGSVRGVQFSPRNSICIREEKKLSSLVSLQEFVLTDNGLTDIDSLSVPANENEESFTHVEER